MSIFDVSTFPAADSITGAPAGMSILKSVSAGLLEPDSFVKGSKELLDTVFKSIERHFEVAKPNIVAD
jgi:hypothetical protein